MPDEELIWFAKNESDNLTFEAFHLLKAEFEYRNLDLGIIDAIREKKAQVEASRKSQFEYATAVTYIQSMLKIAFDEKEKGRSNKEILDVLLKKSINPDFAAMMIQGMESNARGVIEKISADIIIAWLLLVTGLILLLLTFGTATLSGYFYLWGPLLSLAGIVHLTLTYTRRRKFITIIENIEKEKEREENLYQ